MTSCNVSKMVRYGIIKDYRQALRIGWIIRRRTKWRHPGMAASRNGGIQNWRHPWLVHEDWKPRYIFLQVLLIMAMVLELLIEIIEELTQETCALLSSFDQGHTTNALPSPSKVRLANGCAENSHTFLMITPCFPISRLNHRHSMSLLRIYLLGEVRKQFSLSKQPEALLHTLQRDPSISQISIRFGLGFDRSFDCHGMGIGVRVRIFWRLRYRVILLEIILIYAHVYSNGISLYLIVYPETPQ